MSLIIILGAVLVAAGAILSFTLGNKSNLAMSVLRRGSLGSIFWRALGRGLLLIPLYVLVLWISGSLNGGFAGSRIYGNQYVQREFLPLTWGSRNVHAKAGKKVVVSYEMQVERGELRLNLWPSKPLIGNLGPFGGNTVWSRELSKSESGRLVIPIQSDGYYLLQWYPWQRFVGRYRLSWKVE